MVWGSSVRPLALLSVLAAALGACTQPTYVVSAARNQNPSYGPAEYVQASGYRDTKLVVYGLPFVGDRGTFADLVGEAMAGWQLNPPTRFTPQPDHTSRAPYQVVVSFNPVPLLSPEAVCRGEEPEIRRLSRPLVLVSMVLCRADLPLANVHERIPADTFSYRDFGPKLAQMTSDLLLPGADRFNVERASGERYADSTLGPDLLIVPQELTERDARPKRRWSW